ncbi:MAG: hypothetical protein ACAH95_17730 [Fimbriimonas sp.]
MRRFCLPLLALSLVIVACGKEEEAPALPPTDKKITSNANAPQTPPTVSPQESIENVNNNLKTLQRDMTPPPPGTKDWKVAKTKAEGLAEVAESRLAKLQGVSGEATTLVVLEGKRGMSIAKLAIKDADEFYIEYPKARLQPRLTFEKEVLVGNGKEYATNALSTTGWSPTSPVAKLRNEGAVDLQKWITEFPRMIFSSLQGGKPLTNLLAEAKAKGFKVFAEDRTVTARGRVVKQHRIFISRSPEEVKKKGKVELEVVLDDLRMMPVTIRSSYQPLGKQPTNLQWSMRWNFAYAQKFNQNDFVIPKVAAKSTRTAKL